MVLLFSSFFASAPFSFPGEFVKREPPPEPPAKRRRTVIIRLCARRAPPTLYKELFCECRSTHGGIRARFLKALARTEKKKGTRALEKLKKVAHLDSFRNPWSSQFFFLPSFCLYANVFRSFFTFLTKAVILFFIFVLSLPLKV